MVLHKILELVREGVEHLRGGSDDGALMAVSPGEVLGGDDGHTHLRSFEQYQFGVVIGKEALIDCLNDERPKTQRLVGCLMVQQQLYVLDLAAAPDVVQSPDEFLGNREGCLPNGHLALHLSEAPFNDIGHLQLVAEVCLQR